MRPPHLTSFSPLPFGEGNKDRENHLLHVQTSQASLSLWPIFSRPTDQGQRKGYYDQDEIQKQHQEDSERRRLFNSVFHSLSCQSDEDHEDGCNSLQVNCTTSKMKLKMKWTQKFEKSQAFDDENDHTMSTAVTNMATTRVCSDCNTTKTPLWRSGPHGPKSLCNACGIRRRKERRAMTAANDELIPPGAAPATICGLSKHKWLERNHTTRTQYKKRSRSRKKIRFEDFTLSLRNNSAFHQLLPQDEKDAAILLMELSCGLVCS